MFIHLSSNFSIFFCPNVVSICSIIIIIPLIALCGDIIFLGFFKGVFSFCNLHSVLITVQIVKTIMTLLYVISAL